MLSQYPHGRYIITGFNLPPQFFFSQVGVGIWPPLLPVYQTITGMSNQAPGAHTHTATLSSTQHLSPTASTEKETRSITLDSTAKGKEQRQVEGRQLLTSVSCQCYCVKFETTYLKDTACQSMLQN